MSNTDKTQLTEEILQKVYKSKTYLRNEEWDVVWYLGGMNNVTIGQKATHFFLLPQDIQDVVTDILPFEIMHANPIPYGEPLPLQNISDLIRFYPEYKMINKRK